MKEHKIKFIRKTGLFMFLLVGILLILNYYYMSITYDKVIFRKEFEWQEYKKTLSDNTLNYAFLGDSHLYNAINPDYIDGSFNFGTPAEDYVETYYRLKKLLDKDEVKINTLVLEIDTHTFSDKWRTPDRLFMEPSYYVNFVPLTDMAKLKKTSVINMFLDSYFPVFGNGQLIANHLIFDSELTPLHKGWINFTDNYADLNNTKVHSREYFLLNFNSLFNKNPNLLENRSVEYFIKILEIAKEENINVVFIKYPVSNDYINEFESRNLSRDQFYLDLFKKINQTTTEYYILDYYYLYSDKQNHFGDMHHLNYIGAEDLSKKVNNDLKALNLSRKN